MKQPNLLANESIEDSCDDIFDLPHTSIPPRHRITMISAKYRQKEQRRKVLKMSLNKLKTIEDPEANLCRSVLINNTTLRLQKESRDEKIQNKQIRHSYPLLCDTDIYSNISNEMMKNVKETLDLSPNEITHQPNTENLKILLPIPTLSPIDDLDSFSMDTIKSPAIERKRTFDEVENNEVHEVLSQLLTSPTPTLLTEIDEDPLTKRLLSHVDGSENSISSKRLKLDEDTNNQNLLLSLSNIESGLSSSINEDNLFMTSHENLNSCNPNVSCGQASMLCDQSQNSFYYSLVASLET